VLPRKKDGDYRFCVDLRGPNSQTIKMMWPLPRIEDCVAELEGKECFASVDLLSAYFQIALTRAARDKTAFMTPFGAYQFTRTVMGQINSGQHFQRVLSQLLAAELHVSVWQYLDDILMGSRSWSDLLAVMDRVFALLDSAGLKLRPAKCTLYARQLVWAGRMVSAAGVEPDPAFTEKILAFAPPVTCADLQQWLCAVQWIRNYLPDFFFLKQPLYYTSEQCTGQYPVCMNAPIPTTQQDN
jgi:hypothetical protein